MASCGALIGLSAPLCRPNQCLDGNPGGAADLLSLPKRKTTFPLEKQGQMGLIDVPVAAELRSRCGVVLDPLRKGVRCRHGVTLPLAKFCVKQKLC